MKIKNFLLGMLAISNMSIFAENIHNPVLPNVADAGVLKYNGKYYIGGVNTFGDFYVSEDLVNWEGPVHVVTMDNDWTKGTGAKNNQIHANDMLYHNGEFHLYWSVNYWGNDRHAVHIVHAQSDNVTGPYEEPEKRWWMDNRIDPKIFKDDDGQLYMYMVRFTDGNTIWGRKMKNLREFSGEPVCQFASLPGTWETMDNRVAEGPWVFKYRDRYYMMYNANHTGTEWGNYQLGIAEADSPLGFQHGNKYSYPVLGSNQTELEENYVDVLRYSMIYTPNFLYTTEQPKGEWISAGYDASSWKSGSCGFASNEIKGSTVKRYGTSWNTPFLWLRKSFRVEDINDNFALRVTHDGATKIYVNGKLIYDKKGRDYCIVNLSEKQKKAFLQGENILAVETSKGASNYFDVALFDLKDDVADDILFTPGQPNIVRGPNGFEWWLVYMANKNNEHRGQHIDRVHFFDKTLFVDGITGPNTKGFHPLPSKPTFSKMEETSSFGIVQDVAPSMSYLFETNIKTDNDAGIIAWWIDDENFVRVGLDKKSNSCRLDKKENGKSQSYNYPLPVDFRWGVYHQLKIERNDANLKIWLDEIPVSIDSLETIIPQGIRGQFGVFDCDGDALFAGSLATIGFDDINICLKSGEERIFGELLKNYEYSFQLYGLSDENMAGSYPLYIDEKNYIKALFNGKTEQLDVICVKKGKTKWLKSYPLSKKKTVYPDVKYTDFIEKTYMFKAPVWLDSIYISRHDADNKSLFADNMFEYFDIAYLESGEWHPLESQATGIDAHPAYNYLTIPKRKVEGLRFINKNATDLQRHIYKIRVYERLKESYNFRSVRNDDMLYLFVDGEEVDALKIDFETSKFGLCSDNYNADYKGIMYFHVNNEQ